ncbi:MAG: hypothetical protein ACOCU1_03195, partial [Bacillota bacterium]
MKQFKLLFFLGFFLLILTGCTTENQDERFTLTLTMSEAISDVSFINSDNDRITASTTDNITYVLVEIPHNQTINISHSEATFSPDVITVNSNQTLDITVSLDSDDTVDPIDDDDDDDGFDQGDNDDVDTPDNDNTDDDNADDDNAD